MEEDKKLQSLLKSFGMQETSADFDDKVMQKIAAIKQQSATSKSLISELLKRILIFAFIAVIVLLFVFALSIKPGLTSKHVFISMPEKNYIELLYFLISFWVVMSINIWWNKKRQINILF